jgi:2,4-dienoyl-CoA reductase (NADPH2)
MSQTKFKKILEPCKLGPLQIKNRMIKTASGTASSYDMGGFVNKRHICMYEAIARGGAGLIIVEMGGIDPPLGLHNRNQLLLNDDAHIPGFTEIASVVHRHGAYILQQLFHAGPWHDPHSGHQPVSASSMKADELLGLIPSEIPTALSPNQLPRGLTVPEIQDVVDKFAATAERAKKAGFDGVEVNCGTGHLINSFLSRIWNKREDSYGCQNMENRTRFAVEIIKEIKRRLGQDFVVTALINVMELGHARGTTIPEGQEVARYLEKAGIDGIHARANAYSGLPEIIRSEQYFYPEPPKPLIKELDWRHKGAGALVPLAAAIKQVVNIPVITVGRLDPFIGEKVLKQGKADLIGMTRRLLADPELPNKFASGNPGEIRPCTACLFCTSRIRTYQPIACQVNAALGSENDYAIKPAPKKQRVLVIGSGPAGMEAARVAAIRGHEVTLIEKAHKLGGLMPLASLVKGHEGEFLMEFVHYLVNQVTRLGVNVRLGEEASADIISTLKPDAVIVAAGGIPTIPEITGINRRNVVAVPRLHRMLKFYLRFFSPRLLGWLTKIWMPIGKKVVIIGGGLQGCELAEFLVKHGRTVTIVEAAAVLGEGVPERKRHSLFRWLKNKGVTMLAGVKYEEINSRGLTIVTAEGERRTLEADTIVPAVPLQPNNAIVAALKGTAAKIYFVGDCAEPKVIIDAVAAGYRVANEI